MPMIWLFGFGGGISASLNQGSGAFANAGVDYIQYIFPGVMAMSLIFNAIFSALETVKDKEFGFLKEILVAPVPRATIVLGRAFGAASTAAIQATLILVLAPFIGVHLTLPMIAMLVPAIWLVALSLSAIGILMAAWFDNQEAFQFVVNFVNMPMFFLSGSLFPLSQLPDWMSVVVKLNPASYAVDLMRRIVLLNQGIPETVINQFSFNIFGQHPTIMFDVMVLAVFSITLITIAANIFSRPK